MNENSDDRDQPADDERGAMDAAVPGAVEEIHQAPDSSTVPPVATVQSPPGQLELPVPLEPPSLEQLESAIRARLKVVVGRAHAVNKSVVHLLARGGQLEDVRAAATRMVNRQDRRLEKLIARQQQAARLEKSKIEQCRQSLERELLLRKLTIAARSDAWARYENTLAAASAKWFDVISGRRVDHGELIKWLREWLDAAEQRWLDPHASSSADSSKTGATP